MATVDVYRTTPGRDVGAVANEPTEELQLSQEDMDVASLSSVTVPPPVVHSPSAATSVSGPAYVTTTAGGDRERNQLHQVVAESETTASTTVGGTVLITEPVLGVRMLMSSRVSEGEGERERERERMEGRETEKSY